MTTSIQDQIDVGDSVEKQSEALVKTPPARTPLPHLPFLSLFLSDSGHFGGPLLNARVFDKASLQLAFGLDFIVKPGKFGVK